jgi:diguanylate cyclase (GGDEF)-like protein
MSSTGWLVLGVSLGLAVALATVGALAIYLAGIRLRRQAGYVAEVKAAAMTDPLTGILNRRGFLDALDRELSRSRRYGHQFVLAYADVRGLKAVNDSEGHQAGDAVLKEAAGLLRDSARADDVVGRLGGDEMGLLLVQQGSEGAEAVLARIQAELPERRRRLGLSSSWDLTIGVAAYPADGDSASALIAVADRRLYEQRGILILRHRVRRPSERWRSRTRRPGD